MTKAYERAIRTLKHLNEGRADIQETGAATEALRAENRRTERQIKLTEAAVKKLTLPAEKKSHEVRDGEMPNLYVRLTAGGKFYSVRYSVGGRPRRSSLGPAAPGTLAEARKKAWDIVSDARAGKDTVAKQRQEAAKRLMTLAEAVPLYLKDREADMAPRWHKEVQRHLERLWKPLYPLALDSIERERIAQEVLVIDRACGPLVADQARISLSGLYGWALGFGHCKRKDNPTLNIPRRADGKRRVVDEDGTSRVAGAERERVLTDAELRAIWLACDDDNDHSRIIRLLALTAARREEIGGLRWDEVSLDKGEIILPPERTKNRKGHRIPLSGAALDILKSVPRRQGNPFVFGVGKKGGFSGWSACKKRLDARLPADLRAKLEDGKRNANGWRLHDIRRTVATGMQARGVGLQVVEAVLGHVSGSRAGIVGVYQRHEYAAEMRAALASWAESLAALVEGRTAKVVAMARTA